jgi:hypothetical protein
MGVNEIRHARGRVIDIQRIIIDDLQGLGAHLLNDQHLVLIGDAQDPPDLRFAQRFYNGLGSVFVKVRGAPINRERQIVDMDTLSGHVFRQCTGQIVRSNCILYHFAILF